MERSAQKRAQTLEKPCDHVQNMVANLYALKHAQAMQTKTKCTVTCMEAAPSVSKCAEQTLEGARHGVHRDAVDRCCVSAAG